jgi:hypothetical protein
MAFYETNNCNHLGGDISLFKIFFLCHFGSPLFGFFWFVPGFVEGDEIVYRFYSMWVSVTESEAAAFESFEKRFPASSLLHKNTPDLQWPAGQPITRLEGQDGKGAAKVREVMSAVLGGRTTEPLSANALVTQQPVDAAS